MKNLLIAALLIMPALANAKIKFDIGIDLGGIQINIGDFDRGGRFGPGADGYIVVGNGRLYQPTGKVCNLSAVQIVTSGADVFMQDFDVMFGNGETQDIPLRANFSAGHPSQWKPLEGGRRCVVGFSAVATALGGRSWGPDAAIHLYGQQVDRHGFSQVVYLGSIQLDNYFNSFEWHRRHGWNPGHHIGGGVILLPGHP